MSIKTKYCVACNKKQNLITMMFKDRIAAFETNDGKIVCGECAQRVFENNLKKVKDSSRSSWWLRNHSSIEFLHYYNKGVTLSIDKKGNVTGEELFCPFCGSEDVTPLSKHREGFSAGKAVAGAVLAGGVGALVGFAGESSSKVDWLCNDCHKAFTK